MSKRKQSNTWPSFDRSFRALELAQSTVVELDVIAPALLLWPSQLVTVCNQNCLLFSTELLDRDINADNTVDSKIVTVLTALVVTVPVRNFTNRTMCVCS